MSSSPSRQTRTKQLVRAALLLLGFIALGGLLFGASLYFFPTNHPLHLAAMILAGLLIAIAIIRLLRVARSPR